MTKLIFAGYGNNIGWGLYYESLYLGKQLGNASIEDSSFCFKLFVGYENMSHALTQRGLTHFLIHHFKTIQNSKKLQTTTEMWLLKVFNIRLYRKHCRKR